MTSHAGISEKIYSNKGNPTVIDEISLLANNGKKLSILDVGCGAGDNARALIENGHTVDGITISKSEAVISSRYLRNVHIFNLEKGLPDELSDKTYDVVICSHVLEHLCYPDKLLEAIKLKIVQNGYLLVCLPNIMHYKSRLNLIYGKFEYSESGLMDNTHFRWYTYKSAQILLERHNYTTIKKFTTVNLPFGRLTERMPVAIKKPLKEILHLISPGLFGDQLVYLSQVK